MGQYPRLFLEATNSPLNHKYKLPQLHTNPAEKNHGTPSGACRRYSSLDCRVGSDDPPHCCHRYNYYHGFWLLSTEGIKARSCVLLQAQSDPSANILCCMPLRRCWGREAPPAARLQALLPCGLHRRLVSGPFHLPTMQKPGIPSSSPSTDSLLSFCFIVEAYCRQNWESSLPWDPLGFMW